MSHATAIRTKALRFMRRNRTALMDPLTQEVNATGLAEVTADHFDIYENNNFDIPEWLFDLAATIAWGK